MTRKKRNRKVDTSKHSIMVSKFKENQSMNQSVLDGMKYCLFKREVSDDIMLKNFLTIHNLKSSDYNMKTLKEFAFISIESPIDFTNIIKRLQKRVRISYN